MGAHSCQLLPGPSTEAPRNISHLLQRDAQGTADAQLLSTCSGCELMPWPQYYHDFQPGPSGVGFWGVRYHGLLRGVFHDQHSGRGKMPPCPHEDQLLVQYLIWLQGEALHCHLLWHLMPDIVEKMCLCQEPVFPVMKHFGPHGTEAGAYDAL